MKVLSPKFLCLTVYLFIYIGVSNAQKTVLVNGEATKVTVSNQDVTSIDGKVDGHMSGYTQPTSDIYKKVNPRIGVTNTPSTRTVSAPVSSKTEPLLSNTKSVSFAEDKYEITTNAKAYLDTVAKSIKSGDVRTILLKTWYLSGDSDNISLTRRRLDSCKRYLEKQGVGSNLILTSMVAKKETTSEIAILMK